MKLEEYLDTAELKASIEAGWVRVAKHEEFLLSLYTYTEHAQFEGVWNDATRKSRGLIVEDSGEIVAFCMPKFFNYSEHVAGKSYAGPLPLTEDFQIFAKMDGSMGTCFFYAGKWHVATKGSFHSDQAVWATNFLRKKISSRDEVWMGTVGKWFNPLLVDYTYVCEIIYPDNRIVVDYGQKEDLVLITSYWNLTGEEALNNLVRYDWSHVGSTVPEFDPQGIHLEDLQFMADENILIGDERDSEAVGTKAEGYVIRFDSGVRCKIKLSDYLRMHKILTGCTERTIWEVVSQDGDLYRYLENVPDEFRDWVIYTSNDLWRQFSDYVNAVEVAFDDILDDMDCNKDHLPVSREGRKEFASIVQGRYSLISSGLFMLLDQNPQKLEELAWKMCRPEAVKPFAVD